MINVTSQILKFRDFLVHSWPDLDRLMENHNWDDDVGFMDDWVQVNWEFLVERELLQNKGSLKSYIFGDFRVTHSDRAATHVIICKPKCSTLLVDDATQTVLPCNIRLGFGGFIKKLNPGYGWYPPFDYLTAFTTNKKQYFRLAVNSIDFFMEKIG